MFKLLLLTFFIIFLLLKAYYDTNTIEVLHYDIKHPKLGTTFEGRRIAHLSDLHIKRVGQKEEKIIKIINDESPDLIFITGDFVSFKGSYTPVISFLAKLHSPLGIYGVLGNTEYSNENGSCILCHIPSSKNLKRDPEIHILRNDSIELSINGEKVNLIGVDDPVKKKSDLRKVLLKRTADNTPTILLSHSPDLFEEASLLGVDLVLAGHNHGGQIFLTKWIRKIFPLDPTLEFLEGFFQKGKTLMYVSRGYGTSLLPFRFGVKPEIAFFTFKVDKQLAETPYEIKNNKKNLFLGFNLANFFDLLTLNLSPSNSKPPYSVPLTHHRNMLFDFESKEELNVLNWECGKWLELSKEYVTSGNFSLKVILPPGHYSGIDFSEIKKDWSNGKYLKMDIFNPVSEEIPFHIRIDDHKSGWEYEKRFDFTLNLKGGFNQISIPIYKIKTNIGDRPLNIKNIKRLMVFVPDNSQKRTLFLDNFRLE